MYNDERIPLDGIGDCVRDEIGFLDFFKIRALKREIKKEEKKRMHATKRRITETVDKNLFVAFNGRAIKSNSPPRETEIPERRSPLGKVKYFAHVTA